MTTIFFSYTHADEALRDKLEVHLAMLKRQGFIDTWHDRRIPPGANLDHAISAELEQADIVLLLVSPEFLASSYCYDVEMTRALEQHAQGRGRVVPVILRPCDWHDAPFGKLNALPPDGKPVTKWADLDEAFQSITQGLKTLVKPRTMAPLSPSAPSPLMSAPAAPQPMARSSTLAVKRTFSQADQDGFLEESFAYIARYFENSLAELQNRNPGIEARFRQVDANTFNATIYRDGSEVSSCRVALGHQMGKGITYSSGRNTGNGFNEMLSVKADSQGMFLTPLGLANYGQEKGSLTQEGAAEHYWTMLFRPLSR